MMEINLGISYLLLENTFETSQDGWHIQHQKTFTKFFCFDMETFSELLLNILNIKIDCMKLNSTLIYYKCRQPTEQRSWYSYSGSPR